MVRRSYPSMSAALKAKRPGELVSADILNPSASSVGGAKYLLVIVDQYTRFIKVYAQKFIHPTTGDVNLLHFIRVCHNSFGVSIGTLRADLGPEIVTNNLPAFCKDNDVRQEFSATATPIQNGQVERANRSADEGMKAMLLQSDMHN